MDTRFVSPSFSRRQWIGRSAATAGLALLSQRAAGVGPFTHQGPSRLRLGLAAYSFGGDFSPSKDGSPARLDMFQFLDYCAEQNVDGAELTSYYFPKDLTNNYLTRVRRHAHLRGITVTGTAVGNVFTLGPGPEREKEIALVKRWVDHAALLGAPHIRVFAGDARKLPVTEARTNCIAALEECGEYAGRNGVMLGIENHGGIVAEADALLDIVRAVKSPWVGINLDTGNFHTEDPYADLARCAPYAVNVQYKAEIRRKGAKSEMADMPRVMKILRDSGYQGWVTLEYEMKQPAQEKVPELLRQMRKAIDFPGA